MKCSCMEVHDQGSRLFLAVPPCPQIVSALSELRKTNFRLSGTGWVPPANLHLTVFFIGDVRVSVRQGLAELLPELSESIRKPILLEFDSFTLEGGKAGHRSMVWARFHDNDEFNKLTARAAKLLSPFMSQVPRFSNPVPHVTLARIRSGAPPVLDATMSCSICLNGFELWETIRKEDGVCYRVIEKYYSDPS